MMFFVLSLNAGDAVQIEGPATAADPDENITIELGDNVPPWLAAQADRLEQNARAVSDAPAEYLRNLLEYLPQVMFVMLPFFALLLRLAYLFSPFHFLQHLIFALHFHSFAYLLYLCLAAFEYVVGHTDGLFALALLIYLP
ncbi:MAG: hypothetical protein NWQ45_02235, partial [Congregibacter sp.]|nr:hypothetical protein [Congregibacter sp.]